MQAHVQDEVIWLVIGEGWRAVTVWWGADAVSLSCRSICPGGDSWSRGMWTHFINCAESVNFKESHPRVSYLYIKGSQRASMSPLSFNYMSWHDHRGWLCRWWPNGLLVFWVKHEKPVAMFHNSSSSFWEECRSDGSALITELRLLLVLCSC